MKAVVSLVAILFLSSVAHSQSGRRPKEIRIPVPPPVEEKTDTLKQTPAEDTLASPVTAERNQDYRCSDDGTLERIIESEESAVVNASPSERILRAKETDSPVVITAKPQPSYTKEARRNGIQGFVALRVLLSGNGRVSRIRVMKGLPSGLTENAIRAACKMKFKPAIKDGAPVSQWVIAEYAFRLADSSIFRP